MKTLTALVIGLTFLVLTTNVEATQCHEHCSTPRPTPTLQATPSGTPYVTASPSPTASASAVPSQSVEPTATPALPSTEPTNSPSVNTTSNLSDGRSDGQRSALDCVPESEKGRKNCNESKVIPQSAVLPATGEGFDIYAVILALVTLTAGLILVNKGE